MSIFLGMILQNTTLFPAVLMFFLEPSGDIFCSKVFFGTSFFRLRAPWPPLGLLFPIFGRKWLPKRSHFTKMRPPFGDFLAPQNHVFYCKTNSFVDFRLCRKRLKNQLFHIRFWQAPSKFHNFQHRSKWPKSRPNVHTCFMFFIIFHDFRGFFFDIHIFAPSGSGSRSRDLGSIRSTFGACRPKKYSISETIGSWAGNRYLNPPEKHHTQLF